MQSLREISLALNSQQTTSVELIETAIDRAKLSDSVFISVNEGLLGLAEAIDRGRKQQRPTPALAGIPISLKDLFNVRNETTLAGSVVRKHYARAEAKDAEVVAPLREAGLLFFGRTNMSEFAFSGMGKNPHYGTPLSIWDRETGRLPGGSSSGSAVSVAEGIVTATLGSDTAGSCRIPAAFNGIVGVKPSYGRMSLTGIYPLSPTTDAPGPLANDVDSCFILDQLMCGRVKPTDPLPRLQSTAVESLKLVIPESGVMEGLDGEVQTAFENALVTLRAAGADIHYAPLPVLEQCMEFFATRAIALYEAWQHHREMLDQHGDEYDPFVGVRISSGVNISEQEQQDRYRDIALLGLQFAEQYAQLGADAIIYPTVACVPPAISETEDMDDARAVNLKCLRNTATVNYFDGCSMSLPCHRAGEAPVGFMLSTINGKDEELYRIAAGVEAVLNAARG